MAEFKCKYCGNRLHPEEGQTIITCGRCDETTSIVLTDNVKRRRLLEEADELRLSCLFDRAMQRYETVIQEFPKDGEAYWGYVLCIYGVEFQDDARTGKRLPTLHRISTRNIFQDPYYEKAVKYADPIEAENYKRIAKELERIRNRFIELSQKEENTYDIFISFKQTDDKYHRETVDCSKAENLYHKLKDMGYRVFFSKVTLANRGGDDYEPIIYTALETSKVMLVIGSSREHLEAPWVRNEWNRFLDMMQTDSGKKLLPVLIEEMTPESLPDALQSIQGYNVDTQIGMDRLLSRVVQLLPIRQPDHKEDASKNKGFTASEGSLLKRAKMEANAGNWKKARDYYNRILDANPESSEAWIGLMLSADDVQLTELEKYKEFLIEKWFTLKIEKRSVSLSEDSNSFISSCIVPNYFEEDEIMKILPDDLFYESVYKDLCRNMAEAENFFSSNQNYIYAVKYADENYAKILEQFKNDILEKIRMALKTEEDSDAKRDARLKKEYADQLENAKKIIVDKYECALADRDADYSNGMNVKTSKEVPDAIKQLARVGKYRDAPKKLQALLQLQKMNEDIDDGINYLTQRMIEEKPQAIINLQNAIQNLSLKPGGKGAFIALSLYSLMMLCFFVSGDILSIGCIICGVAAGYFLWKKNQPYAAYAIFVLLHTIAGAFFSTQWLIILPVIYITSLVRKNGYAKSLLTRKFEKIAIENAKEDINDYEKNLRASIDAIWNSAIGISYDGVKLTGILDRLENE